MMGRTFSLYLAGRFARTVLAAFAFVFALIYAVDLVEMLRRSGDAPKATAPLMALLSFLRTPTVAEQALPFAVLFGSMIAFLNLSRKLELVVARAAGVSVWQILAPPVLVIGMIGIVSVAAYNPASAWMKQRSDEIENTVFGGRSNPWGDLWLRQKSVDGQAIIHAHGKEAGGTRIQGVEVFNFDDQGNFTERVDAEFGRVAQRLLGIARRQGRHPRASRRFPSRPTCWRPVSTARMSPRPSRRPRRCRSGGCRDWPTRRRRPDSTQLLIC